MEYGEAALESGSFNEAAEHFLFALERNPENPAIVEKLLQTAHGAGNQNARALWAHDWTALSANARGVAKPSVKLQTWMLEEDPHPLLVAKSRAAAVRDLMKFRDQQGKDKRAGTGLVVEWAEDVARTLAAGAPALATAHQGSLEAEFVHDREIWRSTVRSLERLIHSAQSRADHDTVIRAGRALLGMSRQASFGEDCHGPPPISMNREGAIASGAIGRSRRQLAQKDGWVTPLETLEEMDLDQQRAFTVEHASFAFPGATLSPQDWYRVETSCGWETLYGAATTVEEHHKRLVNWYGKDPFIGRPGILRVVPESHGLEAEGTPFYWAGGFQGGDTTTLKFTIGTIPGLGRGITHELTHRFDGGMYGGLPGWLSEGRASWTAAAYGSIYDTEFVANHASFGTMTSARNMGYGRKDKFVELIDGTLEEYRDNYTVGYALFLYLNTWSGVEDGQEPLYHDKLQDYMTENKRRRGSAIKVFESYFADGKSDRPDGIDDFVKQWDEWLAGWYWRDRKPWTKRYTSKTPPGDPAPTVYDEPTWTWLRARAEPWFGQDHARQAGELFVENAMWKEAVIAFEWALRVDEPSDHTLATLETALGHARSPHATWVLKNWRRFDSPRRLAFERTTPPFLNRLKGASSLREAWANAARDYASKGVPLAAAAMAAEHDRLSAILGLPDLEPAVAFTRQEDSSPLHPYHALPYALGRNGWGDEMLVGHEDRLVDGLWYVDQRNGDIHVGRNKPRTGTDTLDQNSPWRDAVVLADEWQDAGRWRMKTQIEMTTAFLNGGMVLGWTRRDRFIRLRLSAGDRQFANGEIEGRRDANQVHWSLDGMWTRGGGSSGAVGFGEDKTTFDIEVLVDGPTVEVHLDGKLAGVFTTLDARPIQGRAGFFTSQGAMRVRTPFMQRLDREAWTPGGAAWGGGLHPARGGSAEWRDLNGRPVTGLPLHESGSLVLWFPNQLKGKGADAGPEETLTHYTQSLERFLGDYGADNPSQGVTVVLPSDTPTMVRTGLEAALEGLVGPGLFFGFHNRPEPDESQWTVGGWAQPWLAFVDPAGILRRAERLKSWRTGLPASLLNLLMQYQDHSRPGTAGSGD